ncbi:ATP-binding protein (plasmid) [Streptomyces sp. AM 4-1-1]|uniref:ATP-binding protein n=1 Tax=Streptomyces sp. AM 4-1-1 TaxID=3028710 RepID=UPI0023B9B654|nr:ATP-binding protein [Streptomyces sp. AM 4-1-1]WEH37882.1 ATP-binding protein [Streptomyces sp. AM 4-1-1]
MPPTTAELVHDRSLGDLLKHRDVVLEGREAPQHMARVMLADILNTDEARTDDAMLVASELIANAIQHAGGAVSFRIEVYELGSALGVVDRASDTGALPPSPSNSSTRPTDLAVNGRGLFIVQNLASAWSVEQTENGKIVIVVLTQAGSR